MVLHPRAPASPSAAGRGRAGGCRCGPVPPSPHSPRPAESCGQPGPHRTRGRPHSPWLLATCPAAAGRAVSRGRRRPTLQSSALTSLHPMAGARRAPRDLGPPRLPVLAQAGGVRRRPALPALPPGAARAGPGASTAGLPGQAAARRARAGGGAGTPAAALPRGAAALGTGRAPATSRRWPERGGRAPLPPPARAGGTFSPAGAPLAGSAASCAAAASSPGRAARCPASPAGGSAEGLQVPQVERDEGEKGRRLLLTLPSASRKLAGRHPRPSAAVPGSAARPSQSVSVSPPLPRSNQKPGGSGVMLAAPS